MSSAKGKGRGLPIGTNPASRAIFETCWLHLRAISLVHIRLPGRIIVLSSTFQGESVAVRQAVAGSDGFRPESHHSLQGSVNLTYMTHAIPQFIPWLFLS